MRKQVGRVVTAVAVVAAVVSGCGGPGRPGAALIVGDEAVPLERIQSQLTGVLDRTSGLESYQAQGGDTAQLSRGIVTSEVLHSLLTRRAAEYGIVVTDAQVDAEIEANGGAEAILAQTPLDLAALRSQVRDTLIAEQIGQRVAPRLSVTVEIVGTGTSRADAEQAARTLAAGGPPAEELLAGPTAQRVVYEAGSFPSGLASVLLGVPAGTVGAYQPSRNEATWNAFRVVERRIDAPAAPAAPLPAQQATQIGIRDAQLAGQVAGIRVNPRYGEWDPIQGRVVPDGQQVGEIILPPAAAAA